MTRVTQIDPSDFDWAAETGPAADVRRIARAATATEGTSTLNEQAVLQLKNRGLRDAELWLAHPDGPDAGDAPACGFAFRHSGDVLDLAVHPDARDAGVGTALARAALPAGRRVDLWSHADHPAAARLATRMGVPRERELVIMRRSLTEDLMPVVEPDGVTIRGFRDGDEEALLAVNASAFAHHPEQGHMTLEDFRERQSESWFDADGLLLAVPSDDSAGLPPLLGFHWTKVHDDEQPAYGEVYVVAVNPKAAGRGLGTVLTLAGLHHLKGRGMDSVLLYVDGDNAPAVAVYTNQGFEVERVEVQYRGVSTG